MSKPRVRQINRAITGRICNSLKIGLSLHNFAFETVERTVGFMRRLR